MTVYDEKWAAREEAKRAYMSEHSLFREEDEHSSCGVGLVVSIDGSKSRKVVENGISALKAIWHRGAVDADGKTGDGCGLLLQKPDSYLRLVAQEQNWNLGKQYAIGMIFFNQDPVKASASKAIINEELAKETLTIGQNTASFLISLALMMYLTFFLLRDGSKLVDLIVRALPLGDEREHALFQKFAEVFRKYLSCRPWV